MFRKPKRKAKAALRGRSDDGEDDHPADALQQLRRDAKSGSDEDDTFALLSEARKRTRPAGKSGTEPAAATTAARDNAAGSTAAVMHSYRSSDDASSSRVTAADLATRAAEHHAVASSTTPTDGKAERGADGIFRDKTRNAFSAGPIRAQTNVRVTARFDYQPDICKDYKDTGFCGFGDTCIYLHDRGDTLTGWQLEQQWEEQQKQKQQDKVLQAFVDLHSDGVRSGDRAAGAAPVENDDGIPFACHICRKAFQDPVVTKCQHYFCQPCIMQHVREASEACPICGKDTSCIFNQPTKLLAKKRRVVGAKATWQEYLDAFTSGASASQEAEG